VMFVAILIIHAFIGPMPLSSACLPPKPSTGSCWGSRHQDSGDSFLDYVPLKASVAIDGTFDKWDATATMTSPDLDTGVCDITIKQPSWNTVSGIKIGKLKGKNFFDASTIR